MPYKTKRGYMLKQVNIYLTIIFTIFYASITFSNECGNPFSNHFGPFDYNSPKIRELGYAGSKSTSILSIVEDAHFTQAVATLKSGRKNKSPLKDLAYTLNVFPNHHLALVAISKFQRINGTSLFKHFELYNADCYLKRAVRFKPKDPIVRIIYGMHLHYQKRYKDSLEQYKIAEKKAPNNPDLLYNIGLVYLQLDKLDLSKKYAKKAYKRGYPLAGLRKKLKKLNYW